MGATAGVLLIAYTISSPASATPDVRFGFKTLDKNRDGFVDPREFGDQRLIILTNDGSSKNRVTAQIKKPSTSPAFSAELRADFADADTNKDRTISLKEFVAYRGNVTLRSFAITDSNTDGRVSLEEYQRLPGLPVVKTGTDFFNSQDTNHDGWLTEDEYRLRSLRLTLIEPKPRAQLPEHKVRS